MRLTFVKEMGSSKLVFINIFDKKDVTIFEVTYACQKRTGLRICVLKTKLGFI